MRSVIAVGVVCLVSGLASVASAQERGAAATASPVAPRAPDEPQTTEDDGAPASVEMSLSVAPTGLLMLATLQLGNGGGALGGLGILTPTLDVGFTIDRNLLLVASLTGSIGNDDNGSRAYVSVPISLLWYLETPRVGHVMPMLRIGALVGYDRFQSMSTTGTHEYWEGGALVRGGITWLADRCIGIRAELGARGGLFAAPNGIDGWSAQLGIDALVGVVLRV